MREIMVHMLGDTIYVKVKVEIKTFHVGPEGIEEGVYYSSLYEAIEEKPDSGRFS